MIRRAFRHPAQVVIQVLSLGIGIAGCLAAYSGLDALALSPIPGVRDRATLVHVGWATGPELLTSREFEAGRTAMDAALGPLAVEGDRTQAAQTPTGAATLRLAFVSPAYFEALGTMPLTGRLLSARDATSATAPPAVISDRLWQRAFDNHPVDGSQTIRIGGREVTIVGVAPHGFPGLAARDVLATGAGLIDVWLPLRASEAWGVAPPSRSPWLMVAGRLSNRGSVASIRARAAVVATTMAGVASPRREPVLNVFASGLDWSEDFASAGEATALYLFLPLCILGIGCANAINLQLARAHQRLPELAVRLALGSSRGQLMRLMVSDTLVVAVLSAGAAIAATRVAVTASEGALDLPLVMHPAEYAFAAILAALVVLCAGVGPAWLSTRHVSVPGVRQESTGGVRHRRLRLTLVSLQLAVCTALLFVSAIGARTLVSLAPTAGRGADRTTVVNVNLAEIRPDRAAPDRFVSAVLGQLAALPAIEAAGAADFSGPGNAIRYSMPGDAPNVGHPARGGFVTPEWPVAMEFRLLSGRGLADANEAGALVNRAMAAALRGRGRSLIVVYPTGAAPTRVSVVGVIDTPVFPQDLPMVFLSMPPMPPAAMTIVARGASATAAREALRRAVTTADPLVPVDRIATLAHVVDGQSGVLGQAVRVGGCVSLAALMMAAAGIYSLMTYSVERRTRELGIRIAVGAGRLAILRLVLADALRAFGAGAGSGLVVGVWIAFLLRSVLPGLSPIDPLAFWPVAIGLFLTTLMASAVPGYVATRIDPLSCVRAD